MWDLAQTYLDRSSDVQTAAAMATFGATPQVFFLDVVFSILVGCIQRTKTNKQKKKTSSQAIERDKRLSRWITTYRQMLNVWQMWTQRAQFDVDRSLLMRTLAN